MYCNKSCCDAINNHDFCLSHHTNFSVSATPLVSADANVREVCFVPVLAACCTGAINGFLNFSYCCSRDRSDVSRVAPSLINRNFCIILIYCPARSEINSVSQCDRMGHIFRASLNFVISFWACLVNFLKM